jgi:hypothetical protein
MPNSHYQGANDHVLVEPPTYAQYYGWEDGGEKINKAIIEQFQSGWEDGGEKINKAIIQWVQSLPGKSISAKRDVKGKCSKMMMIKH